MSKHGTHWMEREDKDAITVVRLKPPPLMDEDVLRDVFDLMYKLISEVNRTQIVLNLDAVDFLPSMGLGKLVMLNRKAQAANGRLALCHLSPSVQESLEHTRLTPLFQIYTTEQEALQSFA